MVDCERGGLCQARASVEHGDWSGEAQLAGNRVRFHVYSHFQQCNEQASQLDNHLEVGQRDLTDKMFNANIILPN